MYTHTHKNQWIRINTLTFNLTQDTHTHTITMINKNKKCNTNKTTTRSKQRRESAAKAADRSVRDATRTSFVVCRPAHTCARWISFWPEGERVRAMTTQMHTKYLRHTQTHTNTRIFHKTKINVR